MNTIRAIILDFDGIVAESNDGKDKAFAELFSLYPDYEKQMADYHNAWFSSSRMNKFRHYVFEFMERPGDEDSVLLMAERFSDLVMKRVISCPDVPGAREFLEEFSCNLPLYISSATPQDELREIAQCRKIESYFTEIYGNPPTEKQEAVYQVLDREKSAPEEIVFIGDSMSDLIVAQETGVRFVARNSGLIFHDENIVRYNDMFEIATVVRNWIAGYSL